MSVDSALATCILDEASRRARSSGMTLAVAVETVREDVLRSQWPAPWLAACDTASDIAKLDASLDQGQLGL